MASQVLVTALLLSAILFSGCAPLEVHFEEASVVHTKEPIILFDDKQEEKQPHETSQEPQMSYDQNDGFE